MKNWFENRLKEPTTFIGFGLLAQAAMVLTKSPAEHVQIVGQTMEQAAPVLASGDLTNAVPFLLSGLMAIFMSEKGKN